MKRIASISLMALMSSSLLMTTAATAKPHHEDSRYEAPRHEAPRHETTRHEDRRDNRGWHSRSEFRKGGHVAYNDWQRGRAVDYRKNKRLSAPPRGYEWRQVDNRYVLAAVATGVIAAIILSK